MGSATKSGAQTSPDIAPFDDMALADLLGEFNGIESNEAREALKYLPALKDGRGNSAIAYGVTGGRYRLVEFDVDVQAYAEADAEDIRLEASAFVETMAAWKGAPTAPQLRFIRGGTYVTGLHYTRLSGHDDDSVAEVAESGVEQGYVVQVHRCFSTKRHQWFHFATDAVKNLDGTKTVTRWGIVTGDPAQLAELRDGLKLADLLDEGVDLGTEGVLLLEEVPTGEVQDNGYPVFTVDYYRPVDLTTGLDIIRKIRGFSRDAQEADVFDGLAEDELTVVIEEPPLD